MVCSADARLLHRVLRCANTAATLGCICGSAVLRNVDAAVVRSVRNDDAAVVRSVSNNASTTFCDCIIGDAASVHHRACRLRCKVIAPCVAMLSSSAA